MVPNVPGTDAARLFEIRGEKVVDNGLVFSGRKRHAAGRRVIGGPRRCDRAVLAEQKHHHHQPDDRGRTLFAHFYRRRRRACAFNVIRPGGREGEFFPLSIHPRR